MSGILSVLIPTTGRKTLAAAIESCLSHRDVSSVLVGVDGKSRLDRAVAAVHEADPCGKPVGIVCVPGGPHRDYGNTVRRLLLPLMPGPWVSYLDDDNELEIDCDISGPIAQAPGCHAFLFRSLSFNKNLLYPAPDTQPRAGNMDGNSLVFRREILESGVMWPEGKEYGADWTFLEAIVAAGITPMLVPSIMVNRSLAEEVLT
jgi:hypothetical protein